METTNAKRFAQVTVPVTGMSCASCSGRVERALREVPGVLEANVNLANERATVSYLMGGVELRDLEKAVSGGGVRARVEGREVLVGSRRFLSESSVPGDGLVAGSEELAREGKTPIFIAVDGETAGLVGVADVVRDESREAVERLHSLGLEAAMLTGDNNRTAEAIARQLGMDRVLAEVRPEDKAAEVKRLQAEGKREGMVGDVINDALALAQADVGLDQARASTSPWRRRI